MHLVNLYTNESDYSKEHIPYINLFKSTFFPCFDYPQIPVVNN